jgi:ribosomal protein S18 acetylase RimI-like enzyme
VRWIEFEDETAAVERWHDRGYRSTDEGYLNLTRALDDVADRGAGDGRIRPVGVDDVEDRASVTYAAFGSPKPFAEYAADYAGFRASPAYPHGWDLLLRDADGRAAACCIAWPDAVSRAGTFEPVATHPELHRRGFGRALLLDGLRRFAARRHDVRDRRRRDRQPQRGGAVPLRRVPAGSTPASVRAALSVRGVDGTRAPSTRVDR